MPELPDITVYVETLDAQLHNKKLASIRLLNPFFLRSVSPKPDDLLGHTVTATRRLGKRVCIGFDNQLWLVIHLMIAGRLHWKPPDTKAGGKRVLAMLDFEDGSLMITEAGTKKRASLSIVEEQHLNEHDPGGVEPLEVDFDLFSKVMTRTNHTLKRALTDPRILSGIGNAYSDEILHKAGLSPILQTQKMSVEQLEVLFNAVRDTLVSWTDQLRKEAKGKLPAKVTAFRPDMAVHGKYGEPCPVCQTKVQRIRYASNETNYCPRCQTGGKLLADRALSRLLKKDWPKTIDELEAG